jgi:hypothetical protein
MTKDKITWNRMEKKKVVLEVVNLNNIIKHGMCAVGIKPVKNDGFFTF